MSLFGLIIVLALVGVVLFLLNTYGSPWIDRKILTIINVVVVIAVIVYVLFAFGVMSHVDDVRVPRVD